MLVLMLRMTLSFLRATPLYYILPFDHTVVLHKFIGIVIVLFAFVHGIGHVGNGGRLGDSTSRYSRLPIFYC